MTQPPRVVDLRVTQSGDVGSNFESAIREALSVISSDCFTMIAADQNMRTFATWRPSTY